MLSIVIKFTKYAKEIGMKQKNMISLGIFNDLSIKKINELESPHIPDPAENEPQ